MTLSVHTVEENAVIVEIFFDKISPACFTVKMLTERVRIKGGVLFATDITGTLISKLLFDLIFLLGMVSLGFFSKGLVYKGEFFDKSIIVNVIEFLLVPFVEVKEVNDEFRVDHHSFL